MADTDTTNDVFEEIASEQAETKARLTAAADRMTVMGQGYGAERMTQGIPSDPLLSSEWHLTGTWGLHADLVWPDYTGAGIRLADFDDGFQYTHPDLAPNYDTSLDRDVGSNDSDAAPATSDDNHGTAVMGVMIADDNGSGVVGVAFDATGVGIRQSFDYGTDAQTLQGFQYALTAQVDVMNNSWGYTTPYSDNFAEVYSGVTLGDIGDAMEQLVEQGRGGLGTSIVFAAGNEGDVGDNVNYHNFQNSPYAITVAAIDSNGHVASFSTPGAALLVAAGGVGILTTDRTSGGYEAGSYATVDGTSFAAPAVSGVIALMLEANPDLGWRDVQQILAYSAQRNDPTSSGWQYNGATNWNGGGLHFNHDYGFGAADAFTAVRLAELWNLQQTSANMDTFTTATSSPNLQIRDNATASTTINVTQNIFIEHVQVHLDINHTWAGDLVVTLISPDGTESVLVNRPGTQEAGDFSGSSMRGIDFTVATNADWGESSLGTWTLQIEDTERNDTGTLVSWNMTFLGHDQTADDLYVYTNALATFSGAELTARSTVSDTDGGNDTLNISAVTTASTVNLATGTGTVAGKAITLAGIDNVYGGDGNDLLTGDGGDNLLAGGRGTNTLDGGAGTDTAIYADDIGSFSFSLVSTSLIYVTHAVGYTVIDTLIDFEFYEFGGQSYTYTTLEAYITFYGSAIRGTSGNDTMQGTPGADTFAGGTGNDTYVINDAGDFVLENPGEGTDTLQSALTYTIGDNVENIVLTGTAAIDATGNALNNSLTGNSAINTLDGGAGADRMAGLGGNDTYYVDNLGDVVVETTGGGTDIVYSSVTRSLAAELYVENLVLTGVNNLSATGNSSANILTGNTGDNTLDGGTGVDTLAGGAGNDTYIVDTAADIISENAGEGNDTVRTAISYTLGSNEVESLVLLGTGALNGTGNAIANTITGTSGINTLNGGAGADTLIGGLGADIYFIDEAGDVIIEDAGAPAGIDTAYITGSYTLSANVEKLVFSGTAGGFTGTGNALANTLTGNIGDNTLDGGAGADKLIGGLGNDTYIIDMTSDSISEAANAGNDTVQVAYSYTLALNLENVTLLGSSAINATGNTLANILTGNAASNILNGMTGADTMAGGAGDDFYFVDNIGDVVQETAGNGIDTVRSTLSFTLGAEVENLLLLGAAVANATGNALNNSLTGSTGANTLNGAAGADTMAGLAGNDTYFVDDILDVVIENTNGGIDTVQVGFSYALGANLEKLVLTGTGNIDGTGNALLNTLTGNAGNNTLDGGAGADKMYGGLGEDTYIVGIATDGVTEAVGAGHDTVLTSVTNTLAANVEDLVQTGVLNIKSTGNLLDNTMFGNSGNSTLDGGAGSDFLDGGFGNDTLTGGTGADIFTFSNTSSFDKITDFSLTQNDRLDISDILIGFTPGVSEISDYVSFATVKGVTTISVDADGAGAGTGFVAIGSVTNLGTMTVDQLFDAGKIIV